MSVHAPAPSTAYTITRLPGMDGWRLHSPSLEERQRSILEKGKKRPFLPRGTSSEYESANGEDPLAAGALAVRQQPPQDMRHHTPEQARVPLVPVHRTPIQKSPKQLQQRIAVVLSPTPKKLREDYVALAEEKEDGQDGKTSRRFFQWQRRLRFSLLIRHCSPP